ncbi:hypothetical protein LCGC14_2930720, partial [marine sediment metagenome]
TYTVDTGKGEYTFTVIVGKTGHLTLGDGEVLCIVDGATDCAHAKAVQEYIAK